MAVVLKSCDGSPSLSIRVSRFNYRGRLCIELDNHGDGGKGYITVAGAKLIIKALQRAIARIPE